MQLMCSRCEPETHFGLFSPGHGFKNIKFGHVHALISQERLICYNFVIVCSNFESLQYRGFDGKFWRYTLTAVFSESVTHQLVSTSLLWCSTVGGGLRLHRAAIVLLTRSDGLTDCACGHVCGKQNMLKLHHNKHFVWDKVFKIIQYYTLYNILYSIWRFWTSSSLKVRVFCWSLS